MLRRDLLRAVVGLGIGAANTNLSAMAEQQARGGRRASPAPLRAGAAKIDITPDEPLCLQGYTDPGNRVSEGVHDRLYLRAFAFGSGTSRLVLVSCDLADTALGAYYQRAVADALGLRPDQLLLCAIHTHSGPLLTLNPSYPNNVEYTAGLRQAFVSVVDRALRAMAPARLAIGRGRSPVGVSRRKILADGRVEMAANPQGAADPEVLVLAASRPGGRPFAVLFDYACHSRSLGSPNKLISGDILGIAEQEVERSRDGVIAGALAGASGDVDPVSVVDGFAADGDRPPETVRLGRLLGEEVVRATGTSREPTPAARVRSTAETLVLPPKHAGQIKSVGVTLGAIDEVAFVGLDCEASVEVGLAIKAASPFAATFVISNCNGWTGYLPTARQHAEGGYEVEHTGFGPSAGDELAGKVVEMLRRL